MDWGELIFVRGGHVSSGNDCTATRPPSIPSRAALHLAEGPAPLGAAATEWQPRREATIGGMSGYCANVKMGTTIAGSSVPRSGGSCHVAAVPALRVVPMLEGGSPRRGLCDHVRRCRQNRANFWRPGVFSAQILVPQSFPAIEPNIARHAKLNVGSLFNGSPRHPPWLVACVQRACGRVFVKS